jgi:CHAD domain-containing protein
MANDDMTADAEIHKPNDRLHKPNERKTGGRATPEREVKLGADADFRLPDLAGTWKHAAVASRPAEQLSTVYLDSDDLRLASWDVSFRYRDGQGWTVKLPGGTSGSLLVRQEVVFEGGSQRPPPAAVDLVSGYLRGAGLRPQIRLRTSRRGVRLETRDGRLLADIVDDEVAVVDGGRPAARFRELEVETTPDTPPGLVSAVVARLRAAGAGSPDPTPKYLRALGGRDAARPEVVLRPLSPGASLGQVTTYAIADGVTRLIRHDPMVRMGTDVEGVHQSRVATRRLRSDLRTLRTALDPRWARELRGELGWLGKELGAARDADVLLGRLAGRARALPAADEGVHELIAALERRRAEAHAELLQQMRDDRYLRLLDRLVDAARTPALLEDEAGHPAREALKPLVRKNWRALDRKVGSLPDQPPADELHIVRILAKRCRYAAELATPILGRRTGEFAAAARALQDTLGELHDAVVAEAWLREWAERGTSARGAFTAGELAAHESRAAAEAVAAWPRAWKLVQTAAPA